MELPVQISFRGVPSSDAIEAKVRARAARLERYYDHIMGCRVMIESPHRRHHQGKLYHVRIDLTVPGGELVVTREPAEHHAHEDVYVAIRDAFDAARRRLEDHARRQRGAVKVHEPRPLAEVCRLFRRRAMDSSRRPTAARCTSIATACSTMVRLLEIGSRVEFVEEPGEQGPQASTVRISGKRTA